MNFGILGKGLSWNQSLMAKRLYTGMTMAEKLLGATDSLSSLLLNQGHSFGVLALISDHQLLLEPLTVTSTATNSLRKVEAIFRLLQSRQITQPESATLNFPAMS